MMMAQAEPVSQVPGLRRGVKLRFDKARDQWALLAPERAFVLDAIAAEILQLVDGERSTAQIAGLLAEKFAAPFEVVMQDTAKILADLANRGAIEL